MSGIGSGPRDAVKRCQEAWEWRTSLSMTFHTYMQNPAMDIKHWSRSFLPAMRWKPYAVGYAGLCVYVCGVSIQGEGGGLRAAGRRRTDELKQNSTFGLGLKLCPRVFCGWIFWVKYLLVMAVAESPSFKFNEKQSQKCWTMPYPHIRQRWKFKLYFTIP